MSLISVNKLTGTEFHNNAPTQDSLKSLKGVRAAPVCTQAFHLNSFPQRLACESKLGSDPALYGAETNMAPVYITQQNNFGYPFQLNLFMC